MLLFHCDESLWENGETQYDFSQPMGGVEQKGVGWRVEVDSTGEGGTAEKQEDQSAPIVSSTSPTPIVVQTGSPVR